MNANLTVGVVYLRDRPPFAQAPDFLAWRLREQAGAESDGKDSAVFQLRKEIHAELTNAYANA